MQEIEDKYGLTIENTNSFTSNSFQHVLNIMIENGKNVMCCFDPAIEHVNNATKQAQIEHSQCFKNQSDEFQISVITEISVRMYKKNLITFITFLIIFFFHLYRLLKL